MTGPVLGLALGLAVVAGLRGTWSPCGLSMLSAINPMAERSRGNRYWLTCAWFVLGALVGGLVLGLVAAVLALAVAPVVGWSPAIVAGAAGLFAVVCLASDARVGPVRLPLLPRQVNERWLADYRRWLYAAGFGAQIGVGFSTYVMTAANYLVAVLAVATGSPVAAIAVGLTFGLVRGLAVTASATARDPRRLAALHRRLEAWGPASLAVAMTAQAVVAVGLGAVAAGPAGAVVGLVAVAAIAVAVRWPVWSPATTSRSAVVRSASASS